MSSMVLPIELYNAARETCIRLFIANGGDVHATWSIQPYPGTAAISCHKPAYGPAQYTLCMPSFPLDVRLPRWKSELIGAYTVHELLHALWTDWPVVRKTSMLGLHGLCNALEDCRIEAKASRGDLVMVSEARRLLQALNAHIAQRALSTQGFALDDPAQFSFILGLVIFAEKLRYVSQLPIDWKARIRPEWLPLFDLALARFDALSSTGDVLQLALDLQALAASLRKPAPAPVKLPVPPVDAQVREAEIVETPNATVPVNAPGQGEDGDGDGEDGDGEDSDGDGEDSEDASGTAGEPKGGEDGEDAGEPAPKAGKPSENNSEAPSAAASEDANSEQGGRDDNAVPDATVPAEDLTDATQSYQEANLEDLSQDSAKETGRNMASIRNDAVNAETIINVQLLRENECQGGGDPAKAGAIVATPAKLRRHLTLAVKSPERVATTRHQVSGRLDMRDMVGIAAGASNVFKRREEDEGKEAAVTLLLDVSGSMAGGKLAAAKGMALHMGDALKAAGVKFEISAFDDRQLQTPKPFNKGWNVETKHLVAGLHDRNGTAMLPSMKACAERLLRVGGVTRRILLVLTDGADSFNADANRALCMWYRSRGVEIVGIGLMTFPMGAYFDDHCVSVDCVRDLSQQGLKTLVKVLDAGAPRAR